MNPIRRLLNFFKAQKQYFARSRQEIAAENLSTMQIAGGVGFVVSVIFFLIAPIIIPTWSITIEYICIEPVLVAAFVFSFFYSRRAKKPEPLTVEIASAVFYILLLAVFIALSVFPYPNTPQIFISLCFMFMPVLMIQRPAVLLCLMGAAEVVFLCLAARFKTDFSLENDVFNTIASLFFSFIIMFITNRLRCRDRAARSTLERLSQTDALTGLMNKKTFEELASQWLSAPEGSGACALLVLDLDNFKQVNDSLGHPYGDALLTGVGAIMQRAFRQSDLVGRIGGDEFAVLMRGAMEPDAMRQKCARLQESLAAIDIGGAPANATCSMGVAISTKERVDYRVLFRTADEALYQVKRSGKSAVSIRTQE